MSNLKGAKALWVEKYRPKVIDEYVFQDDHQRAQIERMINDRDIPHLLLCGVQGSGKTTLARILINALDIDEMDVLEINASDKTGVDYIRDTILGFAESFPIGKFKIIHLEEFDHMSQAAQAMLRVVLEESADTCRFICTCNYVNKIIPAIRSRMQDIHFKAPRDEEVVVKMIEMLDGEGVSFDPDALFAYIKQAYPDIRKIINNLQLNTIDNKLLSPKESGAGADYKFQLIDLMKACDIRGIRKLLASSVPQDEIEGMYEFLYQNMTLIGPAKDSNIADRLILSIADGLRAHATTAFPYITMEATLIKMMLVLAEA
jgi:DNA polymerase III delta prime subunit